MYWTLRKNIMKRITHRKFSLFKLEKQYHKGLSYIGEFGSVITEKCFEHIGTFSTLEAAQLEQKERDFKTKILWARKTLRQTYV